MLHITLLGGFSVRNDGRDILPTEWKRRKAAAIVKILALTPGHRMHREQLMDLLWPDLEPEQAANGLYQALHAARRALDGGEEGSEPVLLVRDQIVQFNPDVAINIDLDVFENAAVRARAHPEPGVIRTALERYGGDLLPDDRYASWASSRREAARDQYLTLAMQLAEMLEADGDYAGGIAAIRRVVADDPLSEAAQRVLMRLYARSGQRQQALRQFESLNDALLRELDVEPEPETTQLLEQILAGDLAGSESPVDRAPERVEEEPAPRHNLPAPVSNFVGREREKADVRLLLASSRLLTLLGVGGAGKTRLALDVAAGELERVADGVWFVELASLADPALVPQAVAEALRVREIPGRPLVETLATSIGLQNILLILDNCEHLIEECALLAQRLLESCANLRILATSREPLQVSGEVTWAVPPLSLPDPDGVVDAEQLARYEAIQLFVERARAVQNTFTLSAENARALATLCYRLDGMPLAIELAAARMRSLSVQQIVERLDDRFRLLTGGGRAALTRQQTLRATFDWSYQLLSDPERDLFTRLSVFAGGFDLAAVGAVCSGDTVPPEDVLDVLDRLVQRSLVVSIPHERSTRYVLLETVREYGRELLSERAESLEMSDRHAAYFLALAEEADRQLRGPEQAAWLHSMRLEDGNLRAALRWYWQQAVDGDPTPGLRLSGRLHWYWQLVGHASEGLDWLGVFLSLSEGIRTSERAYALTGAGWLLVSQGKYTRPSVYLDESIAICREIGDAPGLALALLWATWMALFRGEIDAAQGTISESYDLFTHLGDEWGVATALQGVGFIDNELGDLDSAETAFQQSLVMMRALKDQWGMIAVEQQLAQVAYRRGDFVVARERAAQVIKRARETFDSWTLVQALTLQGEIARAEGDYATAATVCQESLGLSRETGHTALTAWTLRDLGYVALACNDIEGARTTFLEGLDIFQRHSYPLGMTCCLAGLAAVAGATGHPEVAARLLGTVDASLTELGMTLAPADRAEVARVVMATREALGDAPFDAAWTTGRSITTERAIATLDI